jgi:hypothetical protein
MERMVLFIPTAPLEENIWILLLGGSIIGDTDFQWIQSE